jgi:hypothetical protein
MKNKVHKTKKNTYLFEPSHHHNNFRVERTLFSFFVSCNLFASNNTHIDNKMILLQVYFHFFQVQ